MKDKDIVRAIQRELDGAEWDAETLEPDYTSDRLFDI